MLCPCCGSQTSEEGMCAACKLRENHYEPAPIPPGADSSASVVQVLSNEDVDSSTPSSRPNRARWMLLLVPISACFLVWTANYMFVGRHVSQRLASDSRNTGYQLKAHYGSYVDPFTLVLDLRNITSVAPLDLYRGLLQSAGALTSAGRTFDSVILARSGTPVFVIQGQQFRELGSEFDGGQNPVYLIRTLPEKLYDPEGRRAFERWEGGWLGVLRAQMNDVNRAASQWADGSPH
jgi:hypothetical protein